ncbi:zinc finger protein 761-like [Planococcus citri]|uniref:zinc finger protein 761-like n=1 Tax=Planococcus citri TaxID=170843 RepID=UPI0031F7F689
MRSELLFVGFLTEDGMLEASYSGTFYSCPNNCGKRYKHRASLSNHYRFECGLAPQFVCKYCDKKCARKYTLKSHMLSEDGDTDMTTSFADLLEANQENGFLCPNRCGRRYKYLKNVYWHYQHECGKDRALLCDICKKTFTRVASLNLHPFYSDHNVPLVNAYSNWSKKRTKMRPTSPGGTSYLCPNHCGRKYKYYREQHSKVFVCPNGCGRQYKYKGGLTEHLNYECGREKEFKCTQCSKAFHQKRYLERHLGLKHSIIVKL